MNVQGWGHCCNKLIYGNSFEVEHLGSFNYLRSYIISKFSNPNLLSPNLYLWYHEDIKGYQDIGQWTVNEMDEYTNSVH